MFEHIARALYYFQVHLLYASLVALAAWIVTSIPRGSATTKYWIWITTSLNFILPVGALLDRVWASHLYWAAPLGIVGAAANRISRGSAGAALGVIWALGLTLMITRLCLRLRAEHREALTCDRRFPRIFDRVVGQMLPPDTPANQIVDLCVRVLTARDDYFGSPLAIYRLANTAPLLATDPIEYCTAQISSKQMSERLVS